jgi:hypothetical protein
LHKYVDWALSFAARRVKHVIHQRVVDPFHPAATVPGRR